MAKTTSDSILGVIRKESLILDHFEIFVTLLSMGHKGNCFQTECGAATWRTTWPWRRCAGSDCFLVYSCYVFTVFNYKKNFSWNIFLHLCHDAMIRWRGLGCSVVGGQCSTTRLRKSSARCSVRLLLL